MTSELLSGLRGGLIVSCQAYTGEAMRDPRTMSQVAAAALAGGAVAIRAQGFDDLEAIRSTTAAPLIGLVKRGGSGVFITPTLEDARRVAEIGCDIVAVDGTRRPRPDGLGLAETIRGLRQSHPTTLVMADCGSLADAEAAMEADADIVATTLAGYSGERPRSDGPDLELLDAIVRTADRPVVAEGRIRDPQLAVEALRRGAWATVVGTAITHPTSITRSFVMALAAHRADEPAARRGSSVGSRTSGHTDPRGR